MVSESVFGRGSLKICGIGLRAAAPAENAAGAEVCFKPGSGLAR
jgi:hypothetical protein